MTKFSKDINYVGAHTLTKGNPTPLTPFENNDGYFHVKSTFPLLLPITAITELEAAHIYNLCTNSGPEWIAEHFENHLAWWETKYELTEKNHQIWRQLQYILIGNTKVWTYLLSLGIDLFGLIESGQAYDKTTYQ